MYWGKHLGQDKLSEGQTVRILDKDFVLKDGILRQKSIYSEEQSQTKQTFAFKWAQRSTYEADRVKATCKAWLRERYINNDEAKLTEWLKPGCRLLDAGCGSGYSAMLFFGDYLNKVNYLGADISGAVDTACQRFTEAGLPGEFLQADIINLPFSQPTFDIIFSEGVLHHTDSTQRAIERLATLLVPGGRFLFYVYRKKGAIREFTDDYLRNAFRQKTDEETWAALYPLTKLGKALGDLNAVVDVPEAIPELGIPAGKIDIQRLFYWYVCKAYYQPDYTIDEMNHVNFDWYRPLNCFRHTEEEIEKWCNGAKLVIEAMNIQEAGLTVVARKV